MCMYFPKVYGKAIQEIVSLIPLFLGERVTILVTDEQISLVAPVHTL